MRRSTKRSAYCGGSRPSGPSAPLRCSLAPRDHVEEQGPRGVTGHPSANGDRVRQRLVRRGGGAYVAEVITYGPPSAVEVVRQLIVDDNVPDRGHRRSVYAAQWAYAGAACGPHKRYKVMCVVTFARTANGHP
ncbi:hypothetical protein OK349_03625 [Sphingomonas sp. BT-65]|uniref:hypothetical protein n=1 Tax=Sphingomonas sp. BT-65 TaxID=2989821 RepID=UPI0022369BAC|nr:hypothetical protein [Sphingomonas sp. BT-65]MCW4460784.1 hypothetical protein [Sphingomonas sp. BT-65]